MRAVTSFRVGGLMRAVTSFRVGGLMRTVTSFRVGGLMRAVTSFRVGGLMRAVTSFRVGGLMRALGPTRKLVGLARSQSTYAPLYASYPNPAMPCQPCAMSYVSPAQPSLAAWKDVLCCGGGYSIRVNPGFTRSESGPGLLDPSQGQA